MKGLVKCPTKQMKIIFYKKRNTYPKIYWSFDLIELNFINTCKVWSINFTLFNVFFQILKIKKRNETNKQRHQKRNC